MVANRTILLTGGTGAIGRTIAAQIIAQNHSVVLAVRDSEKAKSVMRELDCPESSYELLDMDLTESKSFATLEGLHIDAFIHCARSLESLKTEPNLAVDKMHWELEWELGVAAPYEISRRLFHAGYLRDIIFVSSMYGVVAPTPSLYDDFKKSSPIQYGVIKSAQIHLAKELAVRFAPVRSNTISFGGFEGRSDGEFVRRYSKLNPLGRMLNNQDIFGPIDMLLSNPNMAMTGQNIIIDGGWTTW